MKKYLMPLGILVCLSSSNIEAAFYVDYQGLKKPNKEIANKDDLIMPNGYRLLTDDLNGIVFEIGNRDQIIKTSNFADDVEMKYAIGGIMPGGWSAYVDERLTALKQITYSANNESWLEVLARVGSRYGYKFVVDWKHKVVQISEDENYKAPDPNLPVAVRSSDGDKYFIYKTQQSLDKGYMIVDGQLIPIQIK